MALERKNCWEHMKCGKEAECPAYPDQGKICFSVRGTHCQGKVQGSYMEKIENCKGSCSFYQQIQS